ncbi:MAG: hypothetical protein M1540_01430 [Candidatus Bathyarchaeota archaeon]|nr:hypothetical protein [Candidatus Bathyarchaeota archaeon]
MSVLSRIPKEEIIVASHVLWDNKSIADQVAKESIQIINQTYKRKFSFFNGRKSKWVVGGLFYLLGYRYGSVKKQGELADKLGTSDTTIRDSYRLWLKTFPDLFVDVIGKMANDQNLKYFVLVDLKKEVVAK